MTVARTDDSAEAAVLAAAIRKATEIRKAEMRELANMIRTEMVEAWNGGKKKGKG